MDDEYVIKWTSFLGSPLPVLCQSANGPCPLLALTNALLLLRRLKLTPGTRSLRTSLIVPILAQHMRASAQKGVTDPALQANIELLLRDVTALLPRLSRGLDVNVQFKGATSFEFTPALSVFDLAGIKLIHGWVVDPASPLAPVIAPLSYNQLLDRMVHFDELLSRPHPATPPAASTAAAGDLALRAGGGSSPVRESSLESAASAPASPAPASSALTRAAAEEAAFRLSPASLRLLEDPSLRSAVSSALAAGRAAPALAAPSASPTAHPHGGARIIPVSFGTPPPSPQPTPPSAPAHSAPVDEVQVPASLASLSSVSPSAGGSAAEPDAVRILLPLSMSGTSPSPPLPAPQPPVANDAAVVSSRDAAPGDALSTRAAAAAASVAASTNTSPSAGAGAAAPSASATDDAVIDETMLHDMEAMRTWLEGTSSQLSEFGLRAMHECLEEHEVAIFFRNNHFSTIFKHAGHLFLLITDEGYSQLGSVVWECLDDVAGNTQLVDAEWNLPLIPLMTPTQRTATDSPTHAHFHGAPPTGHLPAVPALPTGVVPPPALLPSRLAPPADAAAVPAAAANFGAPQAHVPSRGYGGLPPAVELPPDFEECSPEEQRLLRQALAASAQSDAAPGEHAVHAHARPPSTRKQATQMSDAELAYRMQQQELRAQAEEGAEEEEVRVRGRRGKHHAPNTAAPPPVAKQRRRSSSPTCVIC